MATLIKLLDADVTEIIFETNVERVTGGYCETCYYEYDLLTGRIGFRLANSEEVIIADFADMDCEPPEELMGISTTDMFRVFLDVEFLTLLSHVKVENLKEVFLNRLFDTTESQEKKRLMKSYFWDELKEKEINED